MSMVCRVCTHPKRLAIDKEIIQGLSLTKIAKKYDVPYQSVYNHSQNHLSRQLLKAWEIKTTEQSMDILSEVEELIRRTKKILTTAETEKKFHVALSAIREARGSYELLSKIAFALHQARLSELELERLKSGEGDKELVEEQKRQLQVLTSDELIILRSIVAKMKSGDKKRRIRIPYSYVSRKDREKEKEDYEKEEYSAPIKEPEPETIPEYAKDEEVPSEEAPEYVKDETDSYTVPKMTRTRKPNTLAVKPDTSSPRTKLPRRIDNWIEYSH